MKRLLFFTLAVGIPMFLLVSTANAVSLVSQERVTADEGTAQVVMICCDAIVARENVETFGGARMADIWAPRSSAENSNITQTENAAPGDYSSVVLSPFIDCGSTWTLSMIGRAAPGDWLSAGFKQISNRRLRTLAEIGRAAPGICLAIVGKGKY